MDNRVCGFQLEHNDLDKSQKIVQVIYRICNLIKTSIICFSRKIAQLTIFEYGKIAPVCILICVL